MSITTATNLKEAFERKQAEKTQRLNEERKTFLLENFVALEDLEPSSDTFGKVLDGLTKLDERLQNIQLPLTAKKGTDLWEELRVSIETKNPNKKLVTENVVGLLNFYATLYELATLKVTPVFTTDDVLHNAFTKHLQEGVWMNQQILQEVNEMTDKQAVSLILGSPKVKPVILLSEGKELLTELQVNTDKLKELSAAIGKVAQLTNKYPTMTNLKQAVESLNKSLSNVVQNKGIVGGGYLEASRTLKKATLLYDAFQEFFTGDMKVVAGLPEMEGAKTAPDQPLKQSLAANAEKVTKIIQARLQPSRISGFLNAIMGQDSPQLGSVIKPAGFAEDVMSLSFNQLKILAGEAAALPPTATVEKATAEVAQQVSNAAQTQPQQPGNAQAVANPQGPTTTANLKALASIHGKDVMAIVANFIDKDGKPLNDKVRSELMNLYAKKDIKGIQNKLLLAAKAVDENPANKVMGPISGAAAVKAQAQNAPYTIGQP